jgi:putative transposase
VEVRYSGHSVYRTEYHIVWVSKYRRRALSPDFVKYTEAVLREVIDRIEGVLIQEVNIQPEHVHLILTIPPRYAVAKVVEIIKSQSTKVVREKFEWLNKVYYGTPSLWSRGYFVSTIGMNEEMMKRYVKYQQRQDSGQAKLEF